MYKLKIKPALQSNPASDIASNTLRGSVGNFTDNPDNKSLSQSKKRGHKNSLEYLWLNQPREKIILWSVIVILSVGIVVLGVVNLNKWPDGNPLKTSQLDNQLPGQLASQGSGQELAASNTQNDTEIVIQEFAKIFEIDEQPTVATIVDVSKLRVEQPAFYKNAQNGDKLLVFTTKQLAFIFRRSEKKIINASGVKVVKETVTTNQK